MKKIISLLLIILLSLTLISCSYLEDIEDGPPAKPGGEYKEEIDEKGEFTSKEDVALYIHIYGKLPKNFVRKKEAIELGWESSKGNLWDVTDKKSIGGDNFGNREGLLPKKPNSNYFECDIDYNGGFRGPKRIVYSDDGLIFYTDDHYNSFTLLYGDE